MSSAPRPAPGQSVGGSAAALAVFVAAAVSSVFVFWVQSRSQWFFSDEWHFIVVRDGGSVHSLLAPHNEHWSTIPVLVYRGLWNLFGLHHYAPFQALTLLGHAAIGCFLRAVMRRAGVQPWVATSAAVAFVLFGPGYQDIVYGFTFGFIAPVGLCLAQLLLVTRPGPLGRRDALALVLGLAALMCSGTAVTTVVIVGLGALLARGWRAAALQTVPLGAVYLWWYVAYGEDAVSRQWPSVSELVRFVARGIDNVFVQLGQFRVVAMLLVLLLVVGCVVSWNDRRKVDGSTSDWRLRLAAPASLAVGGLVFFVVTGVGRTEAYGTSFATRSRYADVGAALLLPAVAVGADALVRRWRQLLVPVCVVLLIGVPFGVRDAEPFSRRPFAGTKRDVLLLARSDLIKTLDGRMRPFEQSESRITVGWLRDAVASGDVPRPAAKVTPVDEADVVNMIALEAATALRTAKSCPRLREPVVRTVRKKDSLVFAGKVAARVRLPGGVPSRWRAFDSAKVARVRVRYGPVEVTIKPVTDAARLCR